MIKHFLALFTTGNPFHRPLNPIQRIPVHSRSFSFRANFVFKQIPVHFRSFTFRANFSVNQFSIHSFPVCNESGFYAQINCTLGIFLFIFAHQIFSCHS